MTEYIAQATKLHQEDPRITKVVFYLDGWVPNSYRYRAPGNSVVVRIADGKPEANESGYDRKRSHGNGPRMVAFSARNGRLRSA